MAAENPKITEALGGAVQRSHRSFHRFLLFDMTDMEPVLMNAAGPRLSPAVLPGWKCSSLDIPLARSSFVHYCYAVLGPGSPLRSWGYEKGNVETPGDSSWASRARARCSLAQFIPFPARYCTSWSYPISCWCLIRRAICALHSV